MSAVTEISIVPWFISQTTVVVKTLEHQSKIRCLLRKQELGARMRVKPKSHQYFPLQIQSGAKSPVKRCLLNFAVTMKMAEIKHGIIRNDSIWDQLIFKKVQVSYSKCKQAEQCSISGSDGFCFTCRTPWVEECV